MHWVQAVAAVLLVSLVSMTRAAVPPNNADFCTDKTEGYYCQHCWQPVYCDSDSAATPTFLTPCGPDTVCQLYPTAGVAICVVEGPGTNCTCTANVCDPYDNTLVDKCSAVGIYDFEECVDGICNDGECGTVTTTVAPPTCAEVGAGWYAIPPACTDGFYCIDENSQSTNPVHCGQGKYVDKNGDCQPAPPVPCSDACKGFCPDHTNCSRYYACDGAGVVVAGPTDCSAGTFFNPNKTVGGCTGTDDTTCDPLTKCSFEASSVTTTTPIGVVTTTPSGGVTTTPSGGVTTTPSGGVTTTTSGGETTPTLPTCSAATAGNYPYGSCSQLYWACRDVGQGNYQWVQMQCPGNYVFSTDPNYPYCVTPGSEATCSAIRSNH